MEYSNADFLERANKNKSDSHRTKNILDLDADAIKDLKELEKTNKYKFANKHKRKQMKEDIKNQKLRKWI